MPKEMALELVQCLADAAIQAEQAEQAQAQAPEARAAVHASRRSSVGWGDVGGGGEEI